MSNSLLKQLPVKAVLLSILILAGFHGIAKAGGIVFEIYLNNHLLLKQQYNKVIAGSPELTLTAANAGDELRIVFTSCGASSSTRSVGIKNEFNEVIKKWDFDNSLASGLSMTIAVKEILDLQRKAPGRPLRLFYFSPDQFRQGYMLASVQPGKKDTALLSPAWIKTNRYVSPICLVSHPADLFE